MSLDMAKVRLTDEEVREASRLLDVTRDYNPGRAVANAASDKMLEVCIAELEKVAEFRRNFGTDPGPISRVVRDWQQVLDGKGE